MRNINHIAVMTGRALKMGEDGGAFKFPSPIDNGDLYVIASNGMGWDHVSVSRNNRCPNWIEMQHIKEIFFDDHETVIQYHPKKDQHINMHTHCLHMWRPQDLNIPMPPVEMV